MQEVNVTLRTRVTERRLTNIILRGIYAHQGASGSQSWSRIPNSVPILYSPTFKGLVAGCHSFLYVLSFYIQCIHSITVIQYIHPSPFAEVLPCSPHRYYTQWRGLHGVPGFEPRNYRSVVWRANHWATPHFLPMKICKTMSYIPFFVVFCC